MILSRSLLLASVVSLGSCQPSTSPPTTAEPAQVDRVISGQTLDIRLAKQDQSIQVRLWGIEAPDRQQQPWANQAREFLVSRVQSQPVTVELLEPNRDRYGRFMARIWHQGSLLNETLVAEGHALVKTQRPAALNSALNTQYDQRLVWAQQRARVLELGIWNPRSPLRQTPAEFRKQPSFSH